MRDYSLLADVLNYDRGPGALNYYELADKVRRLVFEVSYDSLKIMLQACAPQFRLVGIVGREQKRRVIKAQLSRSTIYLYDEIEQHKFSSPKIILNAL
jgi:hypothetical protein